MSNNVEEIVRLEGLAAKAGKATSADRWEAARRIHAELQTKSLRELSDEITSLGGKGSVMHLQRMRKCWDAVGKELAEIGASEFPDFSEIYQSKQIRGESGKEPGQDGRRRPNGDQVAAKGSDDEGEGKRGTREPRDATDKQDHSAHGYVSRAATDIGILYEHQGYWATLTHEDISQLSELARKIRLIVTGQRPA
jgi:hypothetical protein